MKSRFTRNVALLIAVSIHFRQGLAFMQKLQHIPRNNFSPNDVHSKSTFKLSLPTNGRTRSHQKSGLCTLSVVSKDLSTPAILPAEEEISITDPSSEPPQDRGLEIQDKIINGIFLSLSFGYAIYTIFSIDQGITRGWTASEIAMRIPLDNWGAYESYLANKPVVTKTLINVIIYLLGDWLSQTAFQGNNVLDFDIKRTLRNGFIGLCFGPLVHEYYQFSDTILPPEEGLLTRLQKILMDQTIYLTVKCSIYISAVGLLGGDDWPTVKETVKGKIGGVVITAWKFWPLVHCITYGLIPARHRILWVNSVDLVWNAILASQAQKTVEEEPDSEFVSTTGSAIEYDLIQIDNELGSGGNETLSFKPDATLVEVLPASTEVSNNSNMTSVNYA